MWVEITLIIITFLAVMVSLFGQRFWDWVKEPKIELRFDNIYLYSDVITMLLHLKLINQGKSVAKKCRVKILSVVKENDDTKENLIEEPDILKWSHAPKDTRYTTQGEFGSVSIHREHKDITPQGGWELCDFFEISSREKRVTFVSSGRRNFLAEDESYTATIEISGDNLKPMRKEIKFSVPYNFDWTNNVMNFVKIEEVL